MTCGLEWMQMNPDDRKSIFSWAMYDWANSAFATTVMAGFFPVFFHQYWSAGADATMTTARLGTGNSIASLVVGLMAPLLGAIADTGTAKKKFLIFFAYMGVVMTCALYTVSKGNWVLAIMVYIFASIGFSGSIIFYDAFIKVVASSKKADFVSSLGYALGYLGGGVLFAINVWMTLDPLRFGFADASEAVRFSFLTVGVWWAVFTVPLMLFVKEPATGTGIQGKSCIKSGFRELTRTLREVKKYKPVFLFLFAYWFYIDGVDTIVRMAVNYGLSIGLQRNDLILALLITQFTGFPSALGFGFLAAKTGARRCILSAIMIYLFIAVWAAFMHSRSEFYAMAVVIGIVQGGIQALSRSYYSKMIPAEKAAEYFGFYNMIGKFAAIVGPVLIGSAGLLARGAGLSADVSVRVGISSVSLLFITGGVLFYYAGKENSKAIVK